MFDKQIKAITLDFDGTTLQRDKIWLSPRNYRALKECQKRGIVCIPCTGRSADMFPPQFEDGSFRYWFTCCGARVLDRLTGEIIYKDGFTPEQSAEICRIFEGLGIYCEVAAEGRLLFEKDVMDNLYKYPVPPHHVWYMYASGRPVTVYGKLSEFFLSQNIGAEKFNLYGIPEEKYQEMLDRFNSLPYVVTKMSDPVGIQVQSKHVDCIKAMQVLLDRIGITFDEVLSIGDSLILDGDMMQHAAIGVTLENAPDNVKAIADYVTDRYDEDGFAKAIEKLILKEGEK